MAFSESMMVALFSISVVFAVLVTLFAIIRIFSFLISIFSSKKVIAPAAEAITDESEEEFSSGALKLKDVDEQTAAMIMAIVSDESGIPLSELCFKSIRLVEQN